MNNSGEKKDLEYEDTMGTTETKSDGDTAAFLGGGAAGAVAGAALGSLGGPIGTVIGAAIGGWAAAETAESFAIDPAVENQHWKSNWGEKPYAKDKSYGHLAPAYDTVINNSEEYISSDVNSFEDVEENVRERYESNSNAALPWSEARLAAKDAHDRMLQLREERLHVKKDRVTTGEYTLRKEIRSENQTITVPVEREEVVIERHAVTDGNITAGRIRDSGVEEVARITVSEERAHAEIDTVITENVSLGKRVILDTQEVSGTVRKEEVTLETDGTGSLKTLDTIRATK